MRSGIFLIVDIGEGTVDITAHAIIGDRFMELAPPASRACGGTTVNEAFSKFLEDFVDDDGFKRYIEDSSPNQQARRKAELKNLYDMFEYMKSKFHPHSDYYVIEFPRSFWNVYEDSLLRKEKTLESWDESVQLDDDGSMRIQGTKMAEFFEPSIHGVTNLIESYLNENKIADIINTIYWVGGFNGWEYLRNQVEKAIKAKFRGCSFRFVIPPEPEFAVIRGAIFFCCDPSIAEMSDSDSQQLQQQLPTSSEQTATTSEC